MKRILVLLFSVLFTLFVVGTAFANGNLIDEKTAKLVAFNHVISDMKMSNDSWKEGIRFEKSTTLYDLNDNPSAYLFEFMDSQDVPAGYIIISADPSYVPVIEFAYVGRPFIYDALKQIDTNAKQEGQKFKENKKLYYLKGLTYLVECEDEQNGAVVYDITLPKPTKILKQQAKEMLQGDNHHAALWNLLKVSNSNPPTSGDVITDPATYESGYSSVSSDDVVSYNRYYFVTSDFSGYSNHCAPTAGLNLVYYWYYRGKSDLYDSTNWWDDEFADMYTLMQTDENGTYVSNIPAAIESFFSARGYSCDAVNDSWVTWGDITGPVGSDSPFLYHVFGHYIYQNHTVLGVGYKSYYYNITYSSSYIRIADGWTNYANRWVHLVTGLDSKEMTKVTVY